MENQIVRLPFYAKVALILLSICIIVLFLYVSQHVIIPLLFSFLFSILLLPVVAFLNQKMKLPNSIAVFLSLVLFVVFICSVIYFVSWQIADLIDDWYNIKRSLSMHLIQLEYWVKKSFHISYYKQETYIHKFTEESLNGGNELMGSTLSSFSNILLSVVLIPIYIFFILFYRVHIITFLSKIVGLQYENVLFDIMTQIRTVIKSYIVGLLIEMMIVSTLTTIGLALVGVKYAILLGVITAIFNLVPYVGILSAAMISILIALVNTNDFAGVLKVIPVYLIVHFIDANILVPKIVGTKVSINALASLLAIVFGSFMFGIAGMFLAIPLVAILKVIFDRVESLKHWGYAIGHEPPIKRVKNIEKDPPV